MVDFLQKLLMSEWFYAAGALMFAVYSWSAQSDKQLQEERQQSLDKKIENNLRLKSEFRQYMAKISAFPEDNKVIFHKAFGDIQEDEIRTCIYHVIDILSDVHEYYRLKGESVVDSNWKKSFNFVFNPKEMNAIISAYQKFKQEGQFSCEFVLFVDSIISKQSSQGIKS